MAKVNISGAEKVELITDFIAQNSGGSESTMPFTYDQRKAWAAQIKDFDLVSEGRTRTGGQIDLLLREMEMHVQTLRKQDQTAKEDSLASKLVQLRRDLGFVISNADRDESAGAIPETIMAKLAGKLKATISGASGFFSGVSTDTQPGGKEIVTLYVNSSQAESGEAEEVADNARRIFTEDCWSSTTTG